MAAAKFNSIDENEELVTNNISPLSSNERMIVIMETNYNMTRAIAIHGLLSVGQLMSKVVEALGELITFVFT